MMNFRSVTREEWKPLVLNYHYAKRVPSVSYAYGVEDDGKLLGVVTFGKPASNSLCKGVCGESFTKQVYELNRLVLVEPIKNLASQLIGYALKQLKKHNLIIVSYADRGQNHNGYVYQATNFIYTGMTKEHTDKYVPKGKHPRHYNSENTHLRVFRSSKLRYVYFTGDKTFVRECKQALNYPIEPYPKFESKYYELGSEQKRIIIDKNTGLSYTE